MLTGRKVFPRKTPALSYGKIPVPCAHRPAGLPVIAQAGASLSSTPGLCSDSLPPRTPGSPGGRPSAGRVQEPQGRRAGDRAHRHRSQRAARCRGSRRQGTAPWRGEQGRLAAQRSLGLSTPTLTRTHAFQPTSGPPGFLHPRVFAASGSGSPSRPPLPWPHTATSQPQDGSLSLLVLGRGVTPALHGPPPPGHPPARTGPRPSSSLRSLTSPVRLPEASRDCHPVPRPQARQARPARTHSRCRTPGPTPRLGAGAQRPGPTGCCAHSGSLPGSRRAPGGCPRA